MHELTPERRDVSSDRRPQRFLTRCLDLAADPRRLVELLGYFASYPFRAGFAYLSFLRSFARRRKDFGTEQWSGHQDLAAAARVAVFSHFDLDGVLHDFVAHYVEQLAGAGFTVIFVSNSPHLDEGTVARLRPWCGLILKRDNVGYDFGAYKDGIARIPDLRRLESLLLANDSVYGPFHPLKEIVARMDGGADVWGITDSWTHGHHLQSYFLLFSRTALRSAGFSRFWARLRYVNSKRWVIASGEIGLSRELKSDGLSCQALFPTRTAADDLLRSLRDDGNPQVDPLAPGYLAFLRRLALAIRRNRPVNSSLDFWDYLILRRGCPFLKRELLRDNSRHVPFVGQWERVVGAASAYDTSLITRHLGATLRGRPVPDPIAAGQPYRPWFA